MLAALLLPALSGAKANSKQVGCLGNLRQLEAAFQMYAADNGGHLAQNVAFEPEFDSSAGFNPSFGSNSWVYGDMKNESDATNTLPIQSGKLFTYAPQAKAYRCPADSIIGEQMPRVRSYSMNSWIGSAEMESQEQGTPFRIFLKDLDLAAGVPSAISVHVDEHVATLDDGWFVVTMNDSRPFASLPATRHQNAYTLNFADGHAEAYRLRSAVTHLPETQAAAFAEPDLPEFPATNSDWIRFKGITTSL